MSKTACGKTYFRQKLRLNKSFGKLIKTKWVAGIKTNEQREAEIQSCFSNRVEFHLSTESDNPVSLIEKFKLKTRDITNNKSNSVFGEKISLDRLIVMDNVSVLLIIVKNLQNF